MIDKEAIKTRLDAATPGPWKESKSNGAVVSNRPTCRYKSKEEADVDRKYYGGYPICESAISFDRELIAHAPTDKADLLAEVERLEQERDELRAHIDRWVRGPLGVWALSTIADLLKEVELLEGELAKFWLCSNCSEDLGHVEGDPEYQTYHKRA